MFSRPRLSLASLALVLVGCGASQRMVHRGNAQFERCHSTELAEPVDADAARACWEGFLASYSEDQPTHRVRYARERIAALSRGETLRALPEGSPVGLELERTASDADGPGVEVVSSGDATDTSAAGAASDAPTTLPAPSASDAPTASETAATGGAAPSAPIAATAPSPSVPSSAAPAPAPAPGPEPAEPSEDEAPRARTPRYRGDPTCQPVCGPPWDRCIARCGEGRMPCVVACENEYRACMQGCF